VLYRFSAGFPHKLTILFSYINEWQASCLVSKLHTPDFQAALTGFSCVRYSATSDLLEKLNP
jgi:hypothetical protein